MKHSAEFGTYLVRLLKLPRAGGPHEGSEKRHTVVPLSGNADAVTPEESTGDDVTGQTDASNDEGAVVFHACTSNVLTSSQALNVVDLLCCLLRPWRRRKRHRRGGHW